MKSSEPNYKKFPFPVRILISYVILSIVGVVLLDLLAVVLIKGDGLVGFFNTVLSFGLIVVAFVVVGVVLSLILGFLCGSKIYRGIGLYRFTTVTSILCPVGFIGTIALMKLTGMSYTFFNFVTLLLQFSVPPVLMLFMRVYTRRCDCCGLINTFKVSAVKTDNMGTERKFHTEGGYYYDQKSTGRFTENNSVAPETFNVEVTTRTYVPKTTVYDGKFEKKRTTTDYKCAVCGNVIREIKDTETKIGD